MRMFRTFYRMTALFVMAAGLCLIPFLDILMKDRPDVDHLVLIYCLAVREEAKAFLLSFISFYLLYLIYESWFFFSFEVNLKRKKKNKNKNETVA